MDVHLAELVTIEVVTARDQLVGDPDEVTGCKLGELPLDLRCVEISFHEQSVDRLFTSLSPPASSAVSSSLRMSASPRSYSVTHCSHDSSPAAAWARARAR
jgi:hypothetical protein